MRDTALTRSQVLGASKSSEKQNYKDYYTSYGYSNDEVSEGDWLSTDPMGLENNQNWALCDSDCGWCGHCADGII